MTIKGGVRVFKVDAESRGAKFSVLQAFEKSGNRERISILSAVP
jgi:hypothetical protein